MQHSTPQQGGKVLKGKSQRLPGTDDGALALSAHGCCVHQGCKGLVGHLCAMSHILGREQTGHKDPEAAAVGNRSSRAVDVAVGSGSPAVTVGSFSCPSKTLFGCGEASWSTVIPTQASTSTGDRRWDLLDIRPCSSSVDIPPQFCA